MIGKNALIQIISSSLSGLITFFTLSLSARLFGPSVLGNVAYVTGLLGLVFAFSDLGFSRAQVYFTAILKKPGKTLGTFLRLKLFLLFAAVIIALIFALFKQATFQGLFFLMLTYELTTRLAESVFITFEGLGESLSQNFARFIGKLLRLAAVIVFGVSLKNNFGYSLTFVAEGLGLLILAAVLARRFLPLNFSRNLVQKYFKYSLPFFAIIPLSYFHDNSLVVILRHFHPANQVGFFSASFQLVSFLKTLYGAVMIFFFPKMSALFSKKDLEGVKRYTHLAGKYLTTLFAPIFLAAWLFRHTIIKTVLGVEFLHVAPIFSLLLASTFWLMLVAPYDQLLFASKNHRPLILVNLADLAIVVLVSFWLVPQYGALGTVIAVSSSWFIGGLWHLWLVKSRLKITPKFFGLLNRQDIKYFKSLLKLA